MRTIYKYPIQNNPTVVRMPVEAKPVHFAMQNGAPTMWAELNTDAEFLTHRTFQVFGTGHDIPDNGRYIGTTEDGPFIWHLYELTA